MSFCYSFCFCSSVLLRKIFLLVFLGFSSILINWFSIRKKEYILRIRKIIDNKDTIILKILHLVADCFYLLFSKKPVLN